MLRRNSAKSRSDLHLRKSTSSVHGVHLEYIDPAVAQRDAQTAAFQAYTRARTRSKAADMPLFPPTPESSPRRPQADNVSLCRDENTTPRRGLEECHDLQRRQSVRFMGPCSVQGRTPQGRGAGSRLNSRDIDMGPAQVQDDDDTNSIKRSILGNNISNPSQQQPRGPHREPPPVPSPGIAGDYLTVLAAGDEYYTPEDDIASAPSSYRRLRRSRSMFTSDEGGIGRKQDIPSPFSNGKTPSSRLVPSLNNRRVVHSEPTESESPRGVPKLRAPKSMSFLRNRTRSGSNASRDCNARAPGPPQAPGMYEDGSWMIDHGTPRLATKASFFGSRNRRTEAGIRKSLRSNSSADDHGNTNANAATSSSGKEDGFKTKARKVSKSLKTKLKSFFNLAKSGDEPTSLPEQQITAHRTHVTEGLGSLFSSDDDQDALKPIDWSSIHRVPSQVPLVQIVPPNLVHSNRGSVESLGSEQECKVSDDKSLTSWTNSGPSTLTSQQQQQWKEWERQRLSIIRENGSHAPSPSIRRKPLGTQLFQHSENVIVNQVAAGPTVDSQRVYSALMKRVRESNNQNAPEIEQQGRADDMFSPPVDTLPSVESLRNVSRQSPRMKLRVVPQNPYQFSSPGGIRTPTQATTNATLRPDMQHVQAGQFRTGSPAAPHIRQMYPEVTRNEPRDVHAAFETGMSRSASANTQSSCKPSDDPFIEDHREPTSTEDRVHRMEEPKIIKDQSSAFFGSPASHLFRTTSPYRRALRRSMEEEQNTEMRLVSSHQESGANSQNASEDGTQIHRLGGRDYVRGTDSASANGVDYTESIYSTDECGPSQTQDNLDAGARLHEITKKSNPNEADHTPLTYRPARYRVDSSGSSIDWMTWLSANVAKLESSPFPSKLSEVEYALPTMPRRFLRGHVRESAQIYDEDEEDVEAFEPPTHKPTLPTSPLSVVEPNVVKLSPTQRSVKRTTPPSAGRTLLENYSPLDVPPIPVKSILRSTPSPMKRARPKIGHSLASSAASSPGLTAAVQRQFGPVSKKSYRKERNRQTMRMDYQRHK
ncbi:hypothetical protein B0H66DRAFT_572526 [Apodospora peruviana]|uniref:Uncharacterized protein n=1 Tax=Apodospora peruviana TaxID=516989 RepID=A0AAE0ISH3_9PEZI|nr:hypothetical protein B0H66DRAFT_572526 [Apodospora peruviana]